MPPRRPACRALPLGVIREALPVDENAGLISNDPRVVSWWADHEITRDEFLLFAVVHHYLHAPGHEVPLVGCLAAFCLGNGLDVLRPLPARLERCPAHCSTVE